MARIEPLRRDELPEHEPMFALIEQSMGFVPSSLPTIAKVPGLMEALSGLVGTITMSGEIDPTRPLSASMSPGTLAIVGRLEGTKPIDCSVSANIGSCSGSSSRRRGSIRAMAVSS